MVWSPPQIGSRPVAILGGGVLGRRIATSYVAGGFNVHIRDPFPQAREDALKYIEENKEAYTSFCPNGKPAQYGTFTASEDIETAVKDAWLVIEAVPEKIELKIDTFGELDKYAPKDCILGSNSSSFKSSLMLDKVSDERKKLVCNIHYTMPPTIRTVELMTDGYTHQEIFPFVSDVLRQCGMLPATARKESTGFIFNRLWAAVKREILTILAEEVSDAAEIDALWAHMFQASVLPCQLMDRVGLDTVAFIEDNYINERKLDGSLTVDWLRSSYIKQGKLGLKTPEQGGLYPPSTVAVNPPLNPAASSAQASGPKMPPIFVLDVGLGANSPSYPSLSGISTNGKILRLDAPNQPPKALITGLPAPDGIDVDPSVNRMYWTNMGADVTAKDGTLMSATLDGTDKKVLLGDGVLTTPKQLILVKDQEKGTEKLYFCDREGCSVHRCNVDGSEHEVLVQNPGSVGDLMHWCVGITVDLKTRKFYWTQKGPSKSNAGRIFRANIDFAAGENASNRSDIEVVFDKLPEPIDLEIESETGVLYWTDRGEHPRGSSLNCAQPDGDKQVKLLARQFHEPIGLKLDLERKQIFVCDLGGSVYAVDVETGKKTVVHRDEGSYTGLVTLPQA
ncbi:hypothetical protein SMACR_08507 [Sordaria macrospora]|uniref:WGS project CABT00000000 data, contig 2.54 n=2 Tax=Sordaria macrospora TaxID=5147 RepID=F7W9R7_SORMK|nr:uncharacterized protein SMAC_08507 [Sordaria macrospora k-hell]KAA8632170.1 hypothetical protein SMACR_08507 [Sordaria macrospora]KAH7628943.1 hypothetical protein B0T09DRAFT_402273 [Sordaria sp. MPI-SDFR-AT-0083]WPJ57164.1 hypothetical protein SMAC4_08507 [Sordaria macrospora]CCC14058.1 unnamed protein product [Sordaria macrospora k-hell]